MNSNRFQIITPNDCDDYQGHANQITGASWPEFILHDPVADEKRDELFACFNEYPFALWGKESNRMAAMENRLPFHWKKPHEELPESVWDWVFLKAFE